MDNVEHTVDIPRRRVYDAAIEHLNGRINEIETNLKRIQEEYEKRHAVDVTVRDRILVEISDVHKKIDQMTVDLSNHINTEDKKFGDILNKLELQLGRLSKLSDDAKPVIELHHSITSWASVNKVLVDSARWLVPLIVGVLIATGAITLRQGESSFTSTTTKSSSN